MPCARHSHCPFGFGRIIFHELRDYALMNALEESSLLEDVSLFDGLVTLMNFYIYAHILNVTLDNFLLILRMMICLTLEFIGRLPMPFGFAHLTEAQLVQVPNLFVYRLPHSSSSLFYLMLPEGRLCGTVY